MRTTITHAALVAVLTFFSSTGSAQATGQQTVDSKLACHQYIRLYEQQMRIPTQLLETIALAESGRQYKAVNRRIAWPWTVMAEGRGRYFETKEDAISEIRRLQAEGITNIDVGCMQINMRAHGDKFRSVEEAIEPRNNVAYAANFLSSLKQRHHTWSRAIGNYHSATPEFHNRYRDKVLAMWRDNRRTYATAQRSEVIAQRQSLMEQRRKSHLRVASYGTESYSNHIRARQ